MPSNQNFSSNQQRIGLNYENELSDFMSSAQQESGAINQTSVEKKAFLTSEKNFRDSQLKDIVGAGYYYAGENNS